MCSACGQSRCLASGASWCCADGWLALLVLELHLTWLASFFFSPPVLTCTLGDPCCVPQLCSPERGRAEPQFWPFQALQLPLEHEKQRQRGEHLADLPWPLFTSCQVGRHLGLSLSEVVLSCQPWPTQGSSMAVLAVDLGLLTSRVAPHRICGSLPCEMNVGLTLLWLFLCDLRLLYSNRYWSSSRLLLQSGGNFYIEMVLLSPRSLGRDLYVMVGCEPEAAWWSWRRGDYLAPSLRVLRIVLGRWYLTVGLPLRGLSPGLRMPWRLRSCPGEWQLRVDLGEWATLWSACPAGSSKTAFWCKCLVLCISASGTGE